MECRVLILLFILALQPVNAWAQSFTNEAALKGGLSLGATHLETLDNKKDLLPTYGFNTHFLRRWVNWELMASSYINAGSFRRTRQQVGTTEVSGKGNFRSVGLAFPAKYILSRPLWDKWHPYFAAGPAIGLKTYRFTSTSVVGGNYNSKHKLTYDSKGAIVLIGLEQWLPKSKHPAYLEFTYKYLATKKVSEVGGRPTKVLIIGKHELPEKFYEHSFMFSLGMLIF
jgi:hypothetical protein